MPNVISILRYSKPERHMTAIAERSGARRASGSARTTASNACADSEHDGRHGGRVQARRVASGSVAEHLPGRHSTRDVMHIPRAITRRRPEIRAGGRYGMLSSLHPSATCSIKQPGESPLSRRLSPRVLDAEYPPHPYCAIHPVLCSVLVMATDSYFPPTPPHENADPVDPKQNTMSSDVVPNGSAPPANTTTGTKDAPNRMALKLSHLPSRQKIKPVYPRSPSTVRLRLFAAIRTLCCAYTHPSMALPAYMRGFGLNLCHCRSTPTTRHGPLTVATTSALYFFVKSAHATLTPMQPKVFIRLCHYGATPPDHSWQGY